MISIHVRRVIVSFLVDQLLALRNAHDANMEGLFPSEGVEEQKPDVGEDDIEEV